MIPPPEKFHRLIWSQANRCWRMLPRGMHGFGLDDLFAEGLLTYVKFSEAFDPGRGCAFITGLWISLRNRYASILQTTKRRIGPLQWDDSAPDAAPFDELAWHADPEVWRHLQERLDGRLSREAWRAVRLVLDMPEWLQRRMNRHGPAALWRHLGYDEFAQRRVRNEVRAALERGVA